MVILTSFEEGKWSQKYQDQNYSHWKPLDIPKPPKVKKREINYAPISKKHSDYLL